MNSLQSATRTSSDDAIHAAVIMAVGMGFGRFAFTAVYPHMVEEGLLTVHGGSIAASANYAGYLIGALFSIRMRAHHARPTGILSIISTVLCLAALAVMDAPWEVAVLRGIAGAFSAVSMVAGSLWLLEHRRQALLWHRVHERLGTRVALTINLLMQALGVVLPYIAANAPGFLAGALLVGGTFMGTVTIAIPAAQQAAKNVRVNLMAIMTVMYGLGQIAGPILSTTLYDRSHTFSSSLLAAASALVVAAVATLALYRKVPGI